MINTDIRGGEGAEVQREEEWIRMMISLVAAG